ncbi:uncharacterized protein LOC127791654 [Diospyros lotus]|uniref:uncharacterized protein LOC127791654 n=1 Tax=Diospyros lotus TaxID=55363 RepID=UPI0022586F3F|nr:uncharacterized protein LOC127791654 [Diospyros lotus]
MGEEIVDQRNGQARALRDYAMPSIQETPSGITRPSIGANNFEIKPAIIQMIQISVQFSGLPNDDPNAHIANFLEICDTFKQNGVSNDAIRLRLFPFSLRDKAKYWLNSLPAGSITTWDDLAQKFLNKFFPPAKTTKMRNDKTNFMITIDAAAGGALMGKEIDEAYNLLDEMANNSYQWSSERSMPRRTTGVHEIDVMTSLNAKVCEICAGPHVTHECQAEISFIPQLSEQVNYVANQGGRQFNPNAKTLTIQDGGITPTFHGPTIRMC